MPAIPHHFWMSELLYRLLRSVCSFFLYFIPQACYFEDSVWMISLMKVTTVGSQQRESISEKGTYCDIELSLAGVSIWPLAKEREIAILTPHPFDPMFLMSNVPLVVLTSQWPWSLLYVFLGFRKRSSLQPSYLKPLYRHFLRSFAWRSGFSDLGPKTGLSYEILRKV